MGFEFERKYAATPEALDAIRAAFPGSWQTIAMETAYYDTPGHDLSARRITLRRRLENGESVCTLKTPAVGGRGEWECRCPDIAAALPELESLGAPREALTLADAGLREVCAARFTRRALLLTLEDCQVELALDQGRLLGGGREEALCEVEAELKSGSREAALAFAQALSARFRLPPEPRSKAARAMALAGR